MVKRREMRYKYTTFLAIKRYNKVDYTEEDDEEEEVLQGEVFVEQDSASDIFNISADSVVVDT